MASPLEPFIAVRFEGAPPAFPVGRAVIRDEDLFTDSIPDRLDFANGPFFIDFGSGRVVLLELGCLGLYEYI